MNDTTKWIMIILLLLLIGAAVFMLLRSPGKSDGDVDGATATGRVDTDRDGVPDAQEDRIAPAGGTADRGVYDQEADTTLPAAERMDEYAHPDAVDDRDRRDEVGTPMAAPPASTEEMGGDRVGSATYEDTTTAPVESRELDDMTTTPVDVAPPPFEDGSVARPLTDAEVTEGGRDEPLTRQEQEPGAARGTVHDDDDRAGQGILEEDLDRHPAAEYPVGEESTTYRATGGDAVVVGEDRPTEPENWTDTHAGPDTTAPDTAYAGWDTAPADTGTGAPPTADEILDGSTQPGPAGTAGTAYVAGGTTTDETAQAPATGMTDQGGYAPVFTEAAYGPGSAEPLEDGSGPAGWEVKGNIGSMLFHTAESPSYDAVRAEVWFESEEAARAAGFAHWDRRRR